MAFGLDPNKIKPRKDLIKNEQNNFTKIICEVTRFIYKDPESGFFVISAKIPEGSANLRVDIGGKTFAGRNFKIIGNSILVIELLKEKQEIECTGNFEIGKDNSIQFNANKVEEKIPTKPKAIELFLSGGKIHGIGPQIAKKIVNAFGVDTISILDKDPNRLLEIGGINERKLDIIKKSWETYRMVYEIISTMQIYGIGDGNGLRIFTHFKEEALSIIKTTPYRLTEVPKIGFKTADKIAQSNGVSNLDPNRVAAGILYTLEKISEDEGSTVYPLNALISKANENLKVSDELIKTQIEYLINTKDLIFKRLPLNIKNQKAFNVINNPSNNKNEFIINSSILDEYYDETNLIDCVSHQKLHNTEQKISKELNRIMTYPHTILDTEKYVEEVSNFLQKNEFDLDESQSSSAQNIVTNKVCVLTGGPGTGKTHTIKSILAFYKLVGKKVILCAPTGRAAKRMEEATGHSASTMHRLLGFAEGKFKHDETNKLEGDVFIVDESSMIDVWLMNAFLKAMPSRASLLFVGDIDQLPSVGAGNVLKDLIESNMIPVSRLNVIHRQAKNSQIILASHSIINNKMPELFDKSSDSDFIFIETETNNEHIHSAILNLVGELTKTENIKYDDIQIITPRKDTDVGASNLNYSLRGILNPEFLSSSQEDSSQNKIKFCVGDRVMQYKNNYELDIFNGDVGKVVNIDHEDNSMTVTFDNKKIELYGNEINDLRPSYAITIHKSQGSDYPYVIIPLSKSHTFMWDVNLLYTAVTRGKKRVFLVGDKQVLFYAIAKFRQTERFTSLQHEIKTLINPVVENTPSLNPF